MSETKNLIISRWVTKAHKEIKTEYGYISPPKRDFSVSLPRKEFRDHRDYKDLITTHEINDMRGFRELRKKHELPEFQHLDLTQSYNRYIVEYLSLSGCYEQRKIYPYMYKMGGMQGRKLLTRKIVKRELITYTVPELKTKQNRKLYVILKCAICGRKKNIVITPTNEGRDTPICDHSATAKPETSRDARNNPTDFTRAPKAQPYFIERVTRERAHLLTVYPPTDFMRDNL